MKRLGFCLVAVTYLAGCAAEVVGEEPIEVEGTGEAVLACNLTRGGFSFPWTSRVGFSQVTTPTSGNHPDLTAARKWLTDHMITVDLSTGSGGRLVAWNDVSFPSPTFVSYLATDTLWTSFALRPWDPTLANAMRTTLINAGWYGNQLYDTLFHDVGTPFFFENDSDKVHGALLATCANTSGKTTQIRAFNYTEGATLNPHPRDIFVDTAVYQALDEYWSLGTRQAGINRLKGIVARSGSSDQIFWDRNLKVFVDAASRRDFDDGDGVYTNATFKVGLVLYAMKVMGVTVGANASENDQIVAEMRLRLKDAQWPPPPLGDTLGGLAHLVTYNAAGVKINASAPTAESTAIGIMAYSANFAL